MGREGIKGFLPLKEVRREERIGEGREEWEGERMEDWRANGTATRILLQGLRGIDAPGHRPV